MPEIHPSTYEAAYNLQKKAFERKIKDAEYPQSLIVARHYPVFTAGRGFKDRTVSINGIPIRRIERGGGITYHGPGQIVFYPVLNLLQLGIKKIERYVFLMEEAARRTTEEWKINAVRREGLPGLWIDEFRKIFSLGIYMRRWTTMHGGALVVKTEGHKFLDDFSPCGLKGTRLTSMEEVLGEEISVEEVKKALIKNFSDIFGKVCLHISE